MIKLKSNKEIMLYALNINWNSNYFPPCEIHIYDTLLKMLEKWSSHSATEGST